MLNMAFLLPNACERNEAFLRNKTCQCDEAPLLGLLGNWLYWILALLALFAMIAILAILAL